MELCFGYVHSDFMGISFPKETITVNILLPYKCHAGTKSRRGIFLPILIQKVVAPDTSPTGRKYITGILLQVNSLNIKKKTDVELSTFVETKYKMDKPVMGHRECHNGEGLLHNQLLWREYQ
jgi:hypothetical protein